MWNHREFLREVDSRAPAHKPCEGVQRKHRSWAAAGWVAHTAPRCPLDPRISCHILEERCRCWNTCRGAEERDVAGCGSMELRGKRLTLAALPVAYVDNITSPDVLLLYLSSQVQTAHGHQVGFIRLQADVLEEPVVKHTSCGHRNRAHAQLHSWEMKINVTTTCVSFSWRFIKYLSNLRADDVVKYLNSLLRGTCLHHEATHAEMCFNVSSSIRFRITVRIFTDRNFLRSSVDGVQTRRRTLHGSRTLDKLTAG